MVPALSRRVISLHTSVLDRNHVFENTLLVHGDSEQFATITSTSAQLLTGGMHTLILALQLVFLIAALLRLQ